MLGRVASRRSLWALAALMALVAPTGGGADDEGAARPSATAEASVLTAARDRTSRAREVIRTLAIEAQSRARKAATAGDAAASRAWRGRPGHIRARERSEGHTYAGQHFRSDGATYVGRLDFLDGGRYRGEVRAPDHHSPMPDGYGTFDHPDGTRYEGRFAGGRPVGFGVLVKADGVHVFGRIERGEFVAMGRVDAE